jgi:hypothetical protein
MQSPREGTVDQTRPATDPAKAAIATGRAETLGRVLQVQKGEMHQLKLRRGLKIEAVEA